MPALSHRAFDRLLGLGSVPVAHAADIDVDEATALVEAHAAESQGARPGVQPLDAHAREAKVDCVSQRVFAIACDLPPLLAQRQIVLWIAKPGYDIDAAHSELLCRLQEHGDEALVHSRGLIGEVAAQKLVCDLGRRLGGVTEVEDEVLVGPFIVEIDGRLRRLADASIQRFHSLSTWEHRVCLEGCGPSWEPRVPARCPRPMRRGLAGQPRPLSPSPLLAHGGSRVGALADLNEFALV